MGIDYAYKKLYVVDDTAFMRVGLIKILGELGFDKNRIKQFENGREAFESLKVSPNECDLILCDWNMPQMTGIDFLKLIRSAKFERPDIPFILITTESEKEKVIEAIQFKVSGYLLKPVNPEKLKSTLEDIFEDQE